MSKFYIANLQLGSLPPSQNQLSTSPCKFVEDSKEPVPAPSDWGENNDGGATQKSPNGSTNALISPATPKFLPQLATAILASWISLATGASLAFVTATLSMLKDAHNSHVHANDEQLSWIASFTMLGALVGGLLSGLGLSKGRRITLWLCAFPLTGAWIALANAQAVLTFYITHFIFGICIGMGNDAAQLYVSEMSHSNSRGALGCIPVAMFNFGTMLFFLAALFSFSWDTLAWIGAGLSLPAIVLPVFLPESPSFLASKRKETEALAALHTLRGSKWDVSLELAELMSCERPPSGIIARLSSLLERSAIQPIILVGAIRLFSRFCGMRAIQTYTHHILILSQSSLPIELATFITGLVQFLSTLVACKIVEAHGRRFSLLFSQGTMAVSLIILATYLIIRPETEDDSTNQTGLGVLPILCIAVYLIANSVGLGPISGLILGELVPQRHRSIASSVTGSFSWLAAFLVTKTYNNFNYLLHLHGTLYLYAGICIIGMIFVATSLPETKGKSQLEIENLFRAKQNKADCKQPEVKIIFNKSFL